MGADRVSLVQLVPQFSEGRGGVTPNAHEPRRYLLTSAIHGVVLTPTADRIRLAVDAARGERVGVGHTEKTAKAAIVALGRIVRQPIAILAVLATGCATPASDASASPVQAGQPTATTRIGRFQVVNPTPEFAKNVMLLDTESGRTWILCTTSDTATATDSNWCPMAIMGEELAPRERALHRSPR